MTHSHPHVDMFTRASGAFWCGTRSSFWTHVEDPHQGQKLVGPFDISACETE